MYFPFIFSLPQIHNLSLYMRKHQINFNRVTTYITTMPIVLKTVKVNQTRKAQEIVTP